MDAPLPGDLDKSRARAHLLVVAAYLALAVAFTWPSAIHPSRYVVSEHLDTMTAFYNYWWFHQAVCVLHVSPWTNTLIDYPHGFSMALFPMWIPYDIAALPFVSAMGADGLPVAFNVITIVSSALCGFIAFLLIRRLTRDSGAAFVGGIILAFAPYRMWNLTRVHASCLGLLALVIYFFIRMLRERSRKTAAGFVIACALVFYTSPPYTADLVIALAVIAAYMAMTEREQVLRKQTLIMLVAAGAAILLVCSPFLLRLAKEALHDSAPVAQTDQLRRAFSANLMGFITPGHNLKAYSFLVPDPADLGGSMSRTYGIGGYEIFLGYSVLALALAGVALKWREARLFAILFVLFTVLSLGPALHAGVHTFGFAMPYKLVAPLLPWLRLERTPVRHMGVAMVSLAVLAGLGLSALREKLGKKRAGALFAASALAVMLEFNQAPLKLNALPVPGFVGEIKSDPVFGSVLDLPELPDIKRIGGWYHMHHGRPLVFQLASRGNDPVFQKTALFRWLDRPAIWLSMTDAGKQRAVSELQKEFKEREIRYVIGYPRFMSADDAKGLRVALEALDPDRVLRDDDLYMVYRFAR